MPKAPKKSRSRLWSYGRGGEPTIGDYSKLTVATAALGVPTGILWSWLVQDYLLAGRALAIKLDNYFGFPMSAKVAAFIGYGKSGIVNIAHESSKVVTGDFSTFQEAASTVATTADSAKHYATNLLVGLTEWAVPVGERARWYDGPQYKRHRGLSWYIPSDDARAAIIASADDPDTNLLEIRELKPVVDAFLNNFALAGLSIAKDDPYLVNALNDYLKAWVQAQSWANRPFYHGAS